MEINLISVIESTSSDSLPQLQKIKTLLQGSLDTTNEFQVKDVFQKTLRIKTGDTFSEMNLFSSFGIVKEDITFIHIQSWNNDSAQYNTNQCKFELKIGAIELGLFSQLTFGNVTSLQNDLTISNCTIPAIDTVNQEGILLIMIGTK